jgi:C-terminal processing protease CtpA/Prc
VDWDDVFVSFGPRLLALEGTDPGIDTLRGMLAELQDPFTTLVSSHSRSVRFLKLTSERQTGGVLLVRFAPVPEGVWRDTSPVLPPELRTASRVVVDLRGQPPVGTESSNVDDLLSQLAKALTPADLPIPDELSVDHRGLQDELDPGATDAVRWSLSQAVVGDAKPGTSSPQIVFILEEGVPVPPFVAELSHAGRASSVGLGQLFVGSRAAFKFPVTAEWTAVIATHTLRGAGPFVPTVTLPVDQAGNALASARTLLEQRPAVVKARGDRGMLPRLATSKPVLARSPTPGERLLGVVKFWSSVQYLYPYASLSQVPWDGALGLFLEKMSKVRDDGGFIRVLVEMGAALNDGHVAFYGKLAESVRPRGVVPFEVMQLGEDLTIVSVEDASSGVEPGWVLKSIEGVEVPQAITRMLPLAEGATRAARWRNAARLALRGPVDSAVQLEIWNGQQRRRANPRRIVFTFSRSAPEALSVSSDRYGYLDLSSPALEMRTLVPRLQDTRGLVVDLRGYPAGSAWLVLTWLNRLNATAMEVVRQPWVSADAPFGTVSWIFSTPFLSGATARYGRPVIALIDERTISAGEDVGLGLEAGADALFVGSATAGTNGITRHIVLPGQVFVRLTATEVLHLDGRPLQGVGLQPQVSIRPTAEDVRAHRDVVLLCALELLRTSLEGEDPSLWRKRVTSRGFSAPEQCKNRESQVSR